ncbi:MAG: hypothetical protein ABL866_14185 [Devosia sp.]
MIDWQDVDTLPTKKGSEALLWATSDRQDEPQIAPAVLGEHGQWNEMWDLDGYHSPLHPLKWAPINTPDAKS